MDKEAFEQADVRMKKAERARRALSADPEINRAIIERLDREYADALRGREAAFHARAKSVVLAGLAPIATTATGAASAITPTPVRSPAPVMVPASARTPDADEKRNAAAASWRASMARVAGRADQGD